MSDNKSKGLSYKRMDLHIHTPASKCFGDKSVSPEDIVKKAIEKKLDAIAITDHNSGDWIDRIKNAAKNKIVVFPGVEISATGGKKVIHVIGIFDTSKCTKDIENLLGRLKFNVSQYGEIGAFTAKSPSEVINEISEIGGLAILAHANSSNGLLCEITGDVRKETIKNQNLIAVEATDFENEKKIKNKKRVVDLLSEENSDFRFLAVYQASDNLSSDGSGKHSLEGIGSRYTYFKLDEITLEGLRQCFCDPKVRIKQKFEYVPKEYPRIIKMEISQGFLKGNPIEFHEGLNSIIGGKGVGKSLILEFLRFGLAQPSKDESILNDHNMKLEKRLGEFGKIAITFEIEKGLLIKLKESMMEIKMDFNVLINLLERSMEENCRNYFLS